MQTFLLAAETEHLGRAAEALQAEQSTVSRKIARLEEEVGIPLFERVGRSVRLTPAGERFAHRARRILDDIRDSVADAQGAASPETGEVTLSFLHTVGTRWLPSRLARFVEAYPAVRFTLLQGTVAEITQGLLQGEIDLGIVGPPPSAKEIEVSPLYREQVAAVVPLNHRLANRPSCSIAELAQELLILPRSRSGLRRLIDEAFSKAGVAQHVAHEGDDFDLVQALVEAGLGVSLLPLPLPHPATEVAIIPLSDVTIERTMALCWDSRRDLPPAASLFAHSLIDEVKTWPSRGHTSSGGQTSTLDTL